MPASGVHDRGARPRAPAARGRRPGRTAPSCRSSVASSSATASAIASAPARAARPGSAARNHGAIRGLRPRQSPGSGRPCCRRALLAVPAWIPPRSDPGRRAAADPPHSTRKIERDPENAFLPLAVNAFSALANRACQSARGDHSSNCHAVREHPSRLVRTTVAALNGLAGTPSGLRGTRRTAGENVIPAVRSLHVQRDICDCHFLAGLAPSFSCAARTQMPRRDRETR